MATLTTTIKVPSTTGSLVDGWLFNNTTKGGTVNTNNPLKIYANPSSCAYMLFKGITIPAGATIETAVFKAELGHVVPPQYATSPGINNIGIRFNTSKDPATLTAPPTTTTNLPFLSSVITAERLSFNFTSPTPYVTLYGNGYTKTFPVQTLDIKNVVQSLVDTYDGYNDENMMVYGYGQSGNTSDPFYGYPSCPIITKNSSKIEITYSYEIVPVDKTTYRFV
jgi:hypothetical protein